MAPRKVTDQSKGHRSHSYVPKHPEHPSANLERGISDTAPHPPPTPLLDGKLWTRRAQKA